MKIYLFNPETGVYLGEDFADEAPMKQGGYIIPPDATTVAPPEVERGQILVFNIAEKRWEIRSVGNMYDKRSVKITQCNNRLADRL